MNGQLWTIPAELQRYVILAVLAVCGIFKRRNLLLLALAGLYLFQISHMILKPDPAAFTGPPMSGNTLVMTFIAGAAAYRYREKIPFSMPLFLLSITLSMWLLFVTSGGRFAAIPITYATVYLGLLNPARQKFALSGDYSYGIYLYGSPIQQTIAWRGTAYHHWYWSLSLDLPATITAAIFSWWCIERPILERFYPDWR